MTDANAASPHLVEAWQCIGCGRIEGPQPCIGVCQDRKVQFVPEAEYARLVERLAAAEARQAALDAFVRRLVRTHPRAGAWEQSYRTLQEQGRLALAAAAPAAVPDSQPADAPARSARALRSGGAGAQDY